MRSIYLLIIIVALCLIVHFARAETVTINKSDFDALILMAEREQILWTNYQALLNSVPVISRTDDRIYVSLASQKTFTISLNEKPAEKHFIFANILIKQNINDSIIGGGVQFPFSENYKLQIGCDLFHVLSKSNFIFLNLSGEW